jgi:hypothetical protein
MGLGELVHGVTVWKRDADRLTMKALEGWDGHLRLRREGIHHTGSGVEERIRPGRRTWWLHMTTVSILTLSSISNAAPPPPPSIRHPSLWNLW